MGESIILTLAIYRIMDWLLVQMTESYSETHNFTLRSARDEQFFTYNGIASPESC